MASEGSSAPKVATQSQWEDLVSRVKNAGSTTIELTNTDPGEGSTLAEGKYIGVYGDAALVQTDDIADNAVTTAKLANSAVTTAKLANSAVTTAKLANSAVTSDKIDFTTLKYLSGMPVAKITRSIGYSLTAYLCRIGNIVVLSTDTVVGSTLPTGLNNSALAETIPSGYRPIVPVAFEGQRQDGSPMEAKWRVQTDGSMTLFTYGTYGTVRWGFNAVWITNDAWPS